MEISPSSKESSASSSTYSGLTVQKQEFLTLSNALNHSFSVKLERTNFLQRRAQMENIIYANGIDDFLEGTNQAPAQTISGSTALNHEFVQWCKKDRLILSWIYSSLSPEIMAQIVGHTPSHTAWTALQQIYYSSSYARIMQLRLLLQTIKKGSMTMMDYILKVKNLTDQLAAILEKISYHDPLLYLLAGLSSDYYSFVVSVTSKSKGISFEQASNLLFAHESRLEQQNSIDELTTIAANAAYRHQSNS
ncbi:uncharacterized protein LOC133799561 [Humulus lupulus]|uniref:uncharacterized protein LOC133799561 n=1 Tax=Humulus lupulus TaxID=3486 RepID=UPI002B411F51|nr:uncharacterized protein LOC133799561 [Humulus lupulus]